MALDVGKIFFGDKDVIAYSSLGIGRLIYQLPIPLCKMFIKEIFENKSPDDFDEETLVTIDKFFENSLNVSETSRQLYIHRNTLVYRLDKLQKSTGLDLRVFEDAITFKIALMVVRYMKYMGDSGVLIFISVISVPAAFVCGRHILFLVIYQYENSERGIWKYFWDLLCVSFVKSIAFLVFSVIR